MQGPDVAQASPAAGKYSGWAQQAPDAVVDRIAVSPSGTIDIA